MYLVDYINLVFSALRRENYIVAYGADLVHAVVAGRIHLDYINIGSRKLPAHLAFSAGVPVYRLRAVYGAGKYLGNGGFAGAARPGKQICMRYSAAAYLCPERFYRYFLPYHFIKAGRAASPIQCLICHFCLPFPKRLKPFAAKFPLLGRALHIAPSARVCAESRYSKPCLL